MSAHGSTCVGTDACCPTSCKHVYTLVDLDKHVHISTHVLAWMRVSPAHVITCTQEHTPYWWAPARCVSASVHASLHVLACHVTVHICVSLSKCWPSMSHMCWHVCTVSHMCWHVCTLRCSLGKHKKLRPHRAPSLASCPKSHTLVRAFLIRSLGPSPELGTTRPPQDPRHTLPKTVPGRSGRWGLTQEVPPLGIQVGLVGEAALEHISAIVRAGPGARDSQTVSTVDQLHDSPRALWAQGDLGSKAA